MSNPDIDAPSDTGRNHIKFVLNASGVPTQNQYVTPKKSSFVPSKYSVKEPDTNTDPLSNQQMSDSEKIRRIVTANQRTEEDAQALYNHIKDFAFFETFNDRNSNSFFGDDAFIRLCQSARYEKHPPKKVIFKEGDPTNGKLYIIYKGNVSVLIKSTSTFAAAQNPECRRSIDTNALDDNSESNVSRDNLRGSQYMSVRGSNMSIPYTGQMKVDEEDSSEASSSRISRRIGVAKTLSPPNPLKQKSEPLMDEGEGLDKLEKKPRQFDFRMSMFGGGLKDAMKWSPSITGRKSETEMPERRMRGSSIDISEGKQSRKPSWKMLQHVMPGIVRIFKTVEDKKHEHMTLRDVLRENGTVQNVLTQGEFFGERAVFEKSTRSVTIVTNTDCEFLVVYKRDFYFVSRNYDRKRTKLLDFIFNFTPDIENIHTFLIAEELLSVLKEKTYEKGSYVIEEGKQGNSFFMVYEGSCELSKTLKIDETPHQKDFLAPIEKLVRVRPVYNGDLLVCNVDRGAFIGEEVLFTDNNTYSFSVKVTSAFATFFEVSKEIFSAKFTKLTQGHIKNLFFSKRKKYANLIRYLLQTKYPNLEVVAAGPDAPENSLPSDHRILNEPLLLKPKDRFEVKKKSRSGLFNALVEQSGDGVLNQYVTTSPTEMAETTTQKREMMRQLTVITTDRKLKDESLSPTQEGSPGLIGDKSRESLTQSQHRDTKKGPHLNRLLSTPLFLVEEQNLKEKAGPTLLYSRTKPLLTRNLKDLKIDTLSEENHIDYIALSRPLSLKAVGSEPGTTKPTIEGIKLTEGTKETQPNTERQMRVSSPKYKSEKKMAIQSDLNDSKFSGDLKGELFEHSKKMKKIFEIQKSKITGKYASIQPTGSIGDSRISPRYPPDLPESIKERLQNKAKSNPSIIARIQSAKALKGPLLLISTSPIEAQPHTYRSPSRMTVTNPITRKDSIKKGMPFLDLPDIPFNDDLADKNSEACMSIKDQLAIFPKTDRPCTARTTKSGRSFKMSYMSQEQIMNKAKNDPNTKMLRMKYKKMLRIQSKKEIEKVNLGPERESVVINYSVNGAIQSFAGQKVFRKVTKRPTSSVSGIKAV